MMQGTMSFKFTAVVFIENLSFQNKTAYHNVNVFVSNLPVVKLMFDTAYHAITYRKGVHRYWGQMKVIPL